MNHAIFISLSILVLGGWEAVRAQEVKNRPLDCTCTDVDPRFGRDKHIKFVRARCWEHLKADECGRGFMFNTVEELSEGFCQITCGRCECCRTLRNVAQDEGLIDWLWAMDTAGLSDVDEPGWEVSVLAPRDGGVDALLARFGWSRSDVEDNRSRQSMLREVLLYNMISPVPNHWAVHTSPFFTEGTQLTTEFEAPTRLTVRQWEGGNIGFQGPLNSATVTSDDFDKASCKGFLHISDEFVLPYEGGSRVTEEVSSVEVTETPEEVSSVEVTETPEVTAVEETSDGCQVEQETEYGGEMLETVKADHSSDCCNKCNERTRCNVWVFCARESGCRRGEGDEPDVWWGDCQLKFERAVSEGGNPVRLENDPPSPFHAGHIVRAATASNPVAG